MHPTIMEGDVVIVKQGFMQLDAYDEMRGPANKDAWARLNKKVVCAIVDGEEPELKRLFVQEAKKKDTGFIMYLRGDNPASRMIQIERETSLKIVGIVQQIMRDPSNFEG
jgi:SOS-response transcriptional repressor LexA